MSDFSLIKNLNTQSKKPKEQKPTGYGIKYEQYDVSVEGKEITVLIPLRECTNFENKITQIKDLTPEKLKQVTRELRGLYDKK